MFNTLKTNYYLKIKNEINIFINITNYKKI